MVCVDTCPSIFWSDVLLVPPIQKLAAFGDVEDGGGEAVVGFGEVGAHRFDERFVREDDRAAEGVADEFAAEVVGEFGVVLAEEIAEAGDAFEGGAGFPLAGVVDGEAGFILGAGAADGVEAFQGEAEGVDLVVADGAGFVLAMALEALAQGGGFAHAVVELGHVVRRGRGGCAEDGDEEPIAAQHGAGAVGIGILGEQGAHA